MASTWRFIACSEPGCKSDVSSYRPHSSACDTTFFLFFHMFIRLQVLASIHGRMKAVEPYALNPIKYCNQFV